MNAIQHLANNTAFQQDVDSLMRKWDIDSLALVAMTYQPASLPTPGITVDYALMLRGAINPFSHAVGMGQIELLKRLNDEANRINPANG